MKNSFLRILTSLVPLFMVAIAGLHGQCLLNPYKPMPTAAEELRLLPDTLSYYVETEEYFDDTLLNKYIGRTFYNYGDYRIAIYANGRSGYFVQTIVILRKINDSLWIQTTEEFNSNERNLDSLYVWMKNGNILKAVSRPSRYSYDFTYNSLGQLISKTVHDPVKGKEVSAYTYEGDRLSGMESITHRQGTITTSFAYTDSTISEFYTITKGESVVPGSRLYQLDTCGNVLSVRHLIKFLGDQTYTQTSITEHQYKPGGGYETSTKHTSMEETINSESHPGPNAWFRYDISGRGRYRLMRWYAIH